MMHRYCVGFAFSLDRRGLLLIEKRKPLWQCGRLNGIGGKIEPGETAADAMVREFDEEAGVEIERWQPVALLASDSVEVHFFRIFTDGIFVARPMTVEPLRLVDPERLPPNVIPNLRQLVPLALYDSDIILPMTLTLAPARAAEQEAA